MSDPRPRGTETEHAVTSLRICVTAAEAYPAFERLFLGARSHIRIGFRIFDLTTRLRSPEAREIGETWFDLIAHTLDRGVSITVTLTDFDPVVATEYHRTSWQSAWQLAAADEAARGAARTGRLDFRISTHPARVGIVPRLVLRGKVAERYARARPDRFTPGLRGITGTGIFDLVPATHHQKLAVFDDETLYIGGLDLDERRYDTPAHDQPAEQTWHDVQAIATGPVVAAAARHLESFVAVAAGARRPPPPRPGFLRTLSARRCFAPFHISPRTVVREIETAHLEAVARAEHLIYAESQYFRHRPLARALARAARRAPGLHVVVVVPAAPDDVAFENNDGQDARMGEALQADAVATVREAFGARALFLSPAQRRAARDTRGRAALNGAPIIYVHSKVTIFDGTEAIVSSANLNGRSFRWDTEAGLRLTDPGQVAALRRRLVDHWMPGGGAGDGTDAAGFVAALRRLVLADAARAPEKRRSFLLPYDESEARKFGERVPIVPEELV